MLTSLVCQGLLSAKHIKTQNQYLNEIIVKLEPEWFNNVSSIIHHNLFITLYGSKAKTVLVNPFMPCLP